MPDDHARSASDDGPDSGSNADAPDDSPGGGPKRVVSETSVDDILSTIGSEPDGNGDEEDPDGGETVDGIGDEDDEDETDESAGDGIGAEEHGEADGEPTERSEDADDGSTDVSVAFDEDELEAEPAAEDPNDDRSEMDESTPEGPSADLADRIERGAVTGADVRAAEAGEGRDPTPSIDDVDLSLDDVETSPASPGETETSADQGANRSTVDDESDRSTADEEANGSERNGVLDRLKRFFSR